ncbi:MAG TPA: glutaredoxin [Polyangiaceae bacterium]|nr:glutaredoxin [Polyangiaceae bacterium]
MATPARPIFDTEKVHPAIADKLGGYQAELVTRVRGLVQQHDLVIVGMSMNPFPGRARKLLDERGIKYEYLGLGSYFSQWRMRLALKMWTGWPTFPMIFVKGTFIGGYEDLKRLLDSGELPRLLA